MEIFMKKLFLRAPHWLPLAAGAGLALLSCTSFAATDVAARLKSLNDLLDEQWQWQMKESPEQATSLGDYRYNDKLSDISLAHVPVQQKEIEGFLKRFQAIDTTGFTEQDQLDRDLMVRQLKESLDGIELKTYEMPEDQFNGIHLQLAQFVAQIPFDTTKQYEDYVTRLNRVPKLIDALIAVLKQGEQDKLMPPQFLLEKVAKQCRSIAEPAGERSAFGQPVARFSDKIAEADRKRLHDAVVNAIDTQVRPAYLKLADFVDKDYALKGRKDPGMWALPNGDALYRYQIRQLTTTNMDPEVVHELGLNQVKQIEAQMEAIATKLGYKDLTALRAALKADAKHHASSRQQILDLYRGYIAQMQPKLPQLFGLLPKAEVKVEPTQEYREKEASAAEYQHGTPDGSRPGIVYVNTGDFAKRSLTGIESTAYHEGVPGHHMQISIAQTLPGLPPFRLYGGYSAYAEGWALYSERLGKEIGFYQDPYSDYGRLSSELLRADRLVLDTGVHYKHWTREQMVDFFRAHSSEDEPDIQAETDRYIAWPAQALGYKLGQLKILELREKAKKDLGAKFDIKAFHDEILNGGNLPLDVMDQRVSNWIVAQKKSG
jgi:uncharacterized protein (DUF885 family)